MLLLFTCINLIITTGVFYLIWDIFYEKALLFPFYRKGNWLVIAVYSVLLYVFTNLYGGYRIGFHRVSEILYSQLISLIFVNAITYLQISLIGHHFLNLFPLLLMLGAQLVLVTVWALVTNQIYFKLFPPRRMVLIHTGGYSLDILTKMNTRAEKFNIVHSIQYKNNLRACCKAFKSFEAVVLSGIPTQARDSMVDFCYRNNIRVYIIPTISDILLSNSDQLHIFDTPLMLLRNRGFSDESRLAKRALDLLVATVALVIALPFMAVIALAIKLYDGGSVLYSQDRLTEGGKIFKLYKFRSMIENAESDGVARLASETDSRITPVGRIIRKLRLDELPQIFNILKGDMSVVGPRPERPEIAAQYEKVMPEFSYRLKVKAGLTGYAQVLGKYNTTPQDKLLLDLMYIESYSLLLDFKLMLMTIKVLFWPESTQGVSQGTVLPIELDDDVETAEEPIQV